MSSVFDIITRRIDELKRLTGFEAKWQKTEGLGVEIFIITFSYDIAVRLKQLIDEMQNHKQNFCSIKLEEMEINESTISYKIRRYRLEIPFNAMSSEIMQRLQKREDYILELSAISNTLRDQHYSFMNTAANLVSGVRDATKMLDLIETEHRELLKEPA